MDGPQLGDKDLYWEGDFIVTCKANFLPADPNERGVFERMCSEAARDGTGKKACRAYVNGKCISVGLEELKSNPFDFMADDKALHVREQAGAWRVLLWRDRPFSRYLAVQSTLLRADNTADHHVWTQLLTNAGRACFENMKKVPQRIKELKVPFYNIFEGNANGQARIHSVLDRSPQWQNKNVWTEEGGGEYLFQYDEIVFRYIE